MLFTTPETWHFAKDFCKIKGGHLVEIDSLEENAFVASMSSSVDRVWISATDWGSEGTWYWDSRKAFNLEASEIPWESGEPNNDQSNNDYENYAEIRTATGRWNDCYGSHKAPFVCEFDWVDGHLNNAVPSKTLEYNGHKYELYDDHGSWEDTKAFCEAQGGHLVTITSAGEQNAVLELMQNCTNGVYNIGATDYNQSGNWSWVTGETFSYNNWDPDYPEPSRDNGEYYAAIIGKENAPNKQVGEWIDAPNITMSGFYGFENTGFICEYDTVCDHSYSYVVTNAPTETIAGNLTGTCSKCGREKEVTLPKLNSSDYSYSVVNEPTCTAEGTAKWIWKVTSYGTRSFTTVLEKVPHQYTSQIMPATCTENSYTLFTCSMCGHSYKEYADGEYSAWSTTRPTGISDDLIQSRTEYRYSDYKTTTSYNTSMYGWTLKSSEWKQSGTGTINYVSSWPSGFNTSHSLYSQYNKNPKSASETATDKTVINSTGTAGYIYYHWCRGTYNDGPINRATSKTRSGEFTSFHAFFSTTNPNSLTASSDGDGSRIYANGSCCKDSHWYYPIMVSSQTYTTYKKLFTYETWTDWSDWDATEYTASSTRKVESRTVYRYVTAAYGEHQWNEGTVTKVPTCIAEGVKTYTCTSCGETKTETIPTVAHKYTSSVVASTCTAGGYTVHTCSVCGDSYNDSETEPAGHHFVNGTCTTCGMKSVCIGAEAITAKAGDTVTIPVKITNNGGFAGFTFVISCDDLVLSDITKGDLLRASDSGAMTKNINNGIVTWMDSVNTTGDGVILNVKVVVSEDEAPGRKIVRIALKDDLAKNFVNESNEPVTVSFEDMIIDIEDGDHVHNYLATVTAPTCTEQGYTTHVCAECGDTYVDSYVPAMGHEYHYSLRLAPTLDKSGSVEGTCTRCQNTTTITLPKMNKTDYTYTVVREATCQRSGIGRYTWKTTEYGKYFFDEAIPKSDHSFEDQVTEPTCTNRGYTTHVCSVCGESMIDSYVDALGHDYGEWLVEKEATCTVSGIEYRVCSRCGDRQTRKVESPGHVESEWIVDYDATCTASGRKHIECIYCGTIIRTGVIAAKGHTETDWIIDKPAGCTTSGSKHIECEVCGATIQTSVVPRLGHNYMDEVTDPTCTEQGFTTHTCSRCGDTYVDTTTTALGHDWGEWVIVKEATPEEDGIEQRTCKHDPKHVETRTFEYVAKLEITKQPMDVEVEEGEDAIFTVEAAGSGLKYQWEVLKDDTGDWEKITVTAGKKAAYSFTAEPDQNGYQYRCIVTDAAGKKVVSEAAMLFVKARNAVKITTQPKNVTVVGVGTKATVTVVAEGEGLTYTWYVKDPGDTKFSKSSIAKSSYSIALTEEKNGRQAYCIVKDAYGNSEQSKTVTMDYVTAKPKITTQPKAATVKKGAKATFKVAATEAKSYQWYYKTSSTASWKAVSAASGKTATYTVTTEAKHNGYQYRCKVTNPVGYTYTNAVKLTVVTAVPKITTQPTAKTVTAGKTATFKVVASGRALSYQWYYRKGTSGTWTKLTAASAKTASYSVKATTAKNGYYYKCVVKNLMGSVTSKVVKLTVKK